MPTTMASIGQILVVEKLRTAALPIVKMTLSPTPAPIRSAATICSSLS